MNVYLASSFKKAYKKLIKKKPQLKEKIKDKIQVFKDNLSHSSLKLHKLTGDLHDNWSFSAEEDIRILFTYVEDGALLVDIGKHEDVY